MCDRKPIEKTVGQSLYERACVCVCVSSYLFHVFFFFIFIFS